MLDKRCIVCCGDVKCTRHRDVILEVAGCAKEEEVTGGVIGAVATQAESSNKKNKKEANKIHPKSTIITL